MVVKCTRAIFSSAPICKRGSGAQSLTPLGLLLLLHGALPHPGAQAGSTREHRDAIECEACNWVVEQLDEVRCFFAPFLRLVFAAALTPTATFSRECCVDTTCTVPPRSLPRVSCPV